jgi:hypothetical protein
MVQIAGLRAKQLREQSGFADAGVYDPQSIGGTMSFTSYMTSRPRNDMDCRRIPSYRRAITYWKWLAKPAGLVLAGLGLLAVFFHRVAVGPKLPQPEDPLPIEPPPDTVEAKRKEQP